MSKKSLGIFSFLVVLALFICATSTAYAADYTPTLTSPASGAIDVQPDNTKFTWQMTSAADSYTIEWSLTDKFSGTDLIFSYTTLATDYTISGLPKGMLLYWHVVAKKDGTDYPSATRTFTTYTDVVSGGTKKYGFDKGIDEDWKVTDEKEIHWTNDRDREFANWFGNEGEPAVAFYLPLIYENRSEASAIETVFTVPDDGSWVSYEWAYEDYGYNDKMYLEYRINGTDDKYTILYTHDAKGLQNMNTGWWYGGYPPGTERRNNKVRFPSSLKGEKIDFRFRVESAGYNYFIYLDNIEFGTGYTTTITQFNSGIDSEWTVSEKKEVGWTCNKDLRYAEAFGDKGEPAVAFDLELMYSNSSKYATIERVFTVPETGSWVSYDWAYQDMDGVNDVMYVEYRKNGTSDKYTLLYTHDEKSYYNFNSGWRYKDHPTANEIRNNIVKFPTATYGMKIDVRFRVVSNGKNPFIWLDNIEFKQEPVSLEFKFTSGLDKEWTSSDSKVFYWTGTSKMKYSDWFGTSGEPAMVCDHESLYYSVQRDAYIETVVTVPEAGGAVTYDWAYGVWYNGYSEDLMYVEYRIADSGDEYRELYVHNEGYYSMYNNYETGWDYGDHPAGQFIHTNKIYLPTDTYGQKIEFRFRVESNWWGDFVWIDNVEFEFGSDAAPTTAELEVKSPYGSPLYFGKTTWNLGDRVTPTCPQTVAGGTVELQYYCTGWVATGSIPKLGTSNTVKVGDTNGFTIYRDSVITWQWEVMYRLLVTSTNGVGNPTPATAYYFANTDVTLSTDLFGSNISPTERLYFTHWTGTGDISGSGTDNSVFVTITQASSINWVYGTQYKLTVASSVTGLGFDPVIGEHWIFNGTDITLDCPTFFDLGGGIGAQYKDYSNDLGITTGQTRPVSATITKAGTFTWLWTSMYYLTANTAFNEVKGSVSGWYAQGSSLASYVDEIADSGVARLRYRAIGYTATGDLSDGSGTSTPSFNITQPTSIVFVWENQFLCNFAANAGTTSPVSGWFSQGAVVDISATADGVPGVSRYVFVRWDGIGNSSYSGPVLDSIITVNEAIDQTAVWSLEYWLTVTPLNGDLNPDPSGWYTSGLQVAVHAVAPQAELGHRYLPRWFGTGSGVQTIQASPTSPASVLVTMNSAIVQQVEWMVQYNLIIEKTLDYGDSTPAPGTYWFFPGASVSGSSSQSDGDFICVGFTAVGSISDSEDLLFSFAINEPTTITWVWIPRPIPVAETWTGFVSMSAAQIGALDLVRLSDGRLICYMYMTGSDSIVRSVYNVGNWSQSTILTNAGLVTQLDATVNVDDSVYIVLYRTNPEGLAYFIDDSFTAHKTDRAVSNIEEIGYLGLHSSSVVINGSLFICYFDANDSALKLAKVVEGGLEVAVIDTQSGEGTFTSMVESPLTHLPVIAFGRGGTNKGLYVVVGDGYVWNVVQVRGQYEGKFGALVMERGGVIHIAYQTKDTFGMYTLHITSFIKGVWIDIVVDGAGDTGNSISIVRDHIGEMRIAYIASENLRYARQTSEGWVTRTLVTGKCGGPTNMSFNGEVPAIAFIYDGKPAYIDGTGTIPLPPVGDDDDDDDPTPVAGGGGGGCFIATAAFGLMSSASVANLTSWRDGSLCGSSIGADLVSLYYFVSPSAAARISSSEPLRILAQKLLQ